MKTTNKKYYKRIDIPDMKRLELVLEDSAIAWKYQNNTVIISYDKPEKCIEAEKKKKESLSTIGTGSSGAGSAPKANGSVQQMLKGPGGGMGAGGQ